METTTATATSVYGTVREVTIDSRGFVHTLSGVLLGERADMERRCWDFAQ